MITNIEFDGIDTKDYPDFCDAYISSADKDGKPITNEELENLDSQFVYDELMKHIF